MSDTALATPPRHARGAHERMDGPVEVRVIPGGLARGQADPRHAQTRLLDGMGGVGFGLSAAERIVAAAFGALFTVAALAVLACS